MGLAALRSRVLGWGAMRFGARQPVCGREAALAFYNASEYAGAKNLRRGIGEIMTALCGGWRSQYASIRPVFTPDFATSPVLSS